MSNLNLIKKIVAKNLAKGEFGEAKEDMWFRTYYG
jgi:hypothetical protein